MRSQMGGYGVTPVKDCSGDRSCGGGDLVITLELGAGHCEPRSILEVARSIPAIAIAENRFRAITLVS